MKICIFERSNEKNHFSKTKTNFYKKTTLQLLEHIGLQNMKVGGKTNLGDLPLFVWCMLTLALTILHKVASFFMTECILITRVHYLYPYISPPPPRQISVFINGKIECAVVSHFLRFVGPKKFGLIATPL